MMSPLGVSPAANIMKTKQPRLVVEYKTRWGIKPEPRTFSPHPDLGQKTWEERAKVAERFGEIDFGCNFKDGYCSKYSGCATSKVSEDTKKEWRRACCSHCANAYGYLDAVNPEHFDFIKSQYDPTDGFWRDGVGCTLPRSMRSATCLSYRCTSAHNNTPKAVLLPWLKELVELTKSGDCNYRGISVSMMIASQETNDFFFPRKSNG